MSKTILSDPINYDVNQIEFSEPEEKKLPDDPTLKYYRVSIKTRNPDGSKGDLVLGLDRSSSFGIGTKYGASLGVVLFDREGPTERQQATVDCLEAIADKCKHYLLEKRKDIKRPKLDINDMKKLGAVKYKENEDGEIDTSKSPMITLKLLTRNKDKAGNVLPEPEIITPFYLEDEVDEHGDALRVNPMEFVDKRCFVTCAVKVDGIFINSTMFKLQLKLYECDIKGIESGFKSLLRPKGGVKVVRQERSTASFNEEAIDYATEETHEEVEQNTRPAILAEDPEEEEAPVAPPKKEGVSKRKGVSKK